MLIVIQIYDFDCRHHETKTVRQRVESYGLKKEEVDGIMRKLEEGHYQIACGLHFAAVHLKELSAGSVSHPNQWYLESRGEVGGGAGTVRSAANKNIKTVRASVYSQSQASTQSSQPADDSQSQLEMMDDSELLEALESSSST